MERREFLQYGAMAMAGGLIGGGCNSQSNMMVDLAANRKGSQKRFSKALKIGMLPRNLSDVEKFKLAKRCGYDGIDGVPLKDLKAAREQARLAREEGIVIHGLVYGWWPAFVNRDKAFVQKKIEEMEHALRCAAEMEADTVLLVPTRVTGDFRYEDAYKYSQEYVSRLIPTAKETQVVIGIENVWNKFLLSPIEFAKYLDELNSPAVRAYFDIGNVIIYAWAEDWIRTLGKRIVKLDLKDFQRKGYQWKNLGDGDVNWKAVREELARIDFRGWATAELSGGDEAYLADVSKRIDRELIISI